MKICGKREYDLLNKMGFVRMGGTEEELKAAHILMDEIKAMGLEPQLEPFEIEDAVQVKAELEVLKPYNKKYVVTAYKLSESTPEEGIVAPFYYAENMTEADMAAAKGKINTIKGEIAVEYDEKEISIVLPENIKAKLILNGSETDLKAGLNNFKF